MASTKICENSSHALTGCAAPCSIVQVVNKCLDEEINVFKHTIQDVVDELEVCCLGFWGVRFRV